jgi:hypothetical protein
MLKQDVESVLEGGAGHEKSLSLWNAAKLAEKMVRTFAGGGWNVCTGWVYNGGAARLCSQSH